MLYFTDRRWVLALIWTLVISLTLQPCSIIFAQTQDDCTAKIKEAEQKFYNGDFETSITLLENCLKTGNLSRREKERAYELLALNYQSKSYLEQANNAIKKLLELAPNYKPNPEQFPPTFVEQVEKVRKEMEGEKPQKSEGGGIPTKWLLIGGGVVVVGVIAYLVFKGGGGDGETVPAKALPEPPSLP